MYVLFVWSHNLRDLILSFLFLKPLRCWGNFVLIILLTSRLFLLVELLTRNLQEVANKGLEENVKSKESCDTGNQDTCISEEKDIEGEDDTGTMEEEPDFSSDAEFFSESGGDTETEDEEKETNGRR